MQSEFKFPVLTINKIEPLFFKDKNIFAYRIFAFTENAIKIVLYENKGLNLSNYIDQKIECLLEITRGKFVRKYAGVDLPENSVAFKYIWIKRAFEFFPELVKVNKDESEDIEESSRLELFENNANQLFADWGLNGLNIGIYQAKPVFTSAQGFFLVNQYEFADDVEYLNLNQEVNIRIDEVLLRGVRPCISSKEPKQKTFTQPKQEPMQSILNESPKKKKGRFDSLLD